MVQHKYTEVTEHRQRRIAPYTGSSSSIHHQAQILFRVACTFRLFLQHSMRHKAKASSGTTYHEKKLSCEHAKYNFWEQQKMNVDLRASRGRSRCNWSCFSLTHKLQYRLHLTSQGLQWHNRWELEENTEYAKKGSMRTQCLKPKISRSSQS